MILTYNLDKRIEREIISMARRFGLKKLILFGSRARGTNRERSDIDLAACGGDILNFAEAVDEQIDTLLSFDVINLDEGVAQDFLAEIDRDGIVLYEEVSSAVKKYEYFSKALDKLLKSATIDPPYSDLELTGFIGLFSICFEQSWKALREVLLLHGVKEASTGSPREILKAGYQFHFIDDEELWLDMLKRRNLTAHIYDEDTAKKLVALIFDKYIAAFVTLRDELSRRLPLDERGRDDCQHDQNNSD